MDCSRIRQWLGEFRVTECALWPGLEHIVPIICGPLITPGSVQGLFSPPVQGLFSPPVVQGLFSPPVVRKLDYTQSPVICKLAALEKVLYCPFSHPTKAPIREGRC